MAKSKCKFCSDRKETSKGIKTPAGFFCNVDHAFKYGNAKKEIGRKKLTSAKAKEKKLHEKKERQRIKGKLKELRPRKYWYDKLQSLINQYITKVRDVNETCCTCNTANLNSAYDAGHFFTRGARSDLRFELTNIHKQCVNCNQYNGGKPKEYADFIVLKYGREHLEWLECEVNHKPLKEQFPHWTDIEKEIVRYRKMLRDNGINPAA
jgi:hypothetical protein